MRRDEWLALAILTGVCQLTLIQASGPGETPWPALVFVGFLAWVVRAGLWALAWLNRRPERATRVRIAAEALVLLTTLALLSRDIPFQIRFRLSEPALTRYAQAVARGDENPPGHAAWVGLFPVLEVSMSGERDVTLRIAPDSYPTSVGLAFSRNGGALTEWSDDTGSTHTYAPIQGRWWRQTSTIASD